MNQYQIRYEIHGSNQRTLKLKTRNSNGIDVIYFESGQWIVYCKPMPETIKKTVVSGIQSFVHLLWCREARKGMGFSFACLADVIRKHYCMDNPKTRATVDALMWCYDRNRGNPDCVPG